MHVKQRAGGQRDGAGVPVSTSDVGSPLYGPKPCLLGHLLLLTLRCLAPAFIAPAASCSSHYSSRTDFVSRDQGFAYPREGGLIS